MTHSEGLHSSNVARCIVTALAIAIVFAGSFFVTLPGLDAHLAFVLPQGAWSWAGGSMFSLGITSFFVAALLVDLSRRVVPPLGRWVREGDSGRKRLEKATICVAMLIAVLPAYYVIRSVNAVVPLPVATKAIWFAMLIAGQAVLAALAWWISKRGIGQGFPIFCAFGILSELHDLFAMMRGTETSAFSFVDGVQLIGVPLFIALCTALILGRRSASSSSWIARAPVSGMGPVVIAYSSPTLVTALALFGIVDARTAAAMTPGMPSFTVVASVFTILLALVLGYVNHSAVQRAPDLRAEFWRSMPMTLLFVLMFIWRPALSSRTIVDPLNVVIATAVCMDVFSEMVARRRLGDLVVITRDIDVALADLEVTKLHRANFAVFQRGVFFSTMTRFFGVLVPIEIMVPADRANEARGVIELGFGSILGGMGGGAVGSSFGVAKRLKEPPASPPS